jgi:RNA polymerase sigma-70 factor (ECF subfamily)
MAFAVFYERHAGRVFAHCHSRIDCRADAEDLTARVFEIAWRRRCQVRVDADADILPWLLVTANHVISEHHRSTTRVLRLLRRLPPLEFEPDHATTLADRDELDHELALAMAVLRALRPVDREIIELCILDGLSPTAVANETGTPASTMRTRLARALVRARRLYRSAALPADGAAGSVRPSLAGEQHPGQSAGLVPGSDRRG